MSQELKQYLHTKRIATSRTTSFNPAGNGQYEKYNDIVWKAIQLSLFTKGEHISHWETTIPVAMHSIRSLLSTATNCTPQNVYVQQKIQQWLFCTLLANQISDSATQMTTAIPW